MHNNIENRENFCFKTTYTSFYYCVITNDCQSLSLCCSAVAAVLAGGLSAGTSIGATTTSVRRME